MRLPLPVRHTFVVACAIAFATAPVAVRGQGGSSTRDIPAEHMPPPGLCRIWVDDVPPGKQPAPTDCAKALRNKPANARVIFGDTKAATPARAPNRGPTPPRGDPATRPGAKGRGSVKPDSTKAQRDSAKAKRDTVAPTRDTTSTPAQRSH